MKKCPKCGHITDSPFCSQCGEDLREVPLHVPIDDTNEETDVSVNNTEVDIDTVEQNDAKNLTKTKNLIQIKLN